MYQPFVGFFYIISNSGLAFFRRVFDASEIELNRKSSSVMDLLALMPSARNFTPSAPMLFQPKSSTDNDLLALMPSARNFAPSAPMLLSPKSRKVMVLLSLTPSARNFAPSAPMLYQSIKN